MLKSVLHVARRIEQLKLDVVVVCPSLKKGEHTQTTTFDRVNFGEFNDNNSGIALRQDHIAEMVSSFTLHNSSLALNDSNITDDLDMNVEHGVLRAAHTSARIVPSLKVFFFVESGWRPAPESGRKLGETKKK